MKAENKFGFEISLVLRESESEWLIISLLEMIAITFKCPFFLEKSISLDIKAAKQSSKIKPLLPFFFLSLSILLKLKSESLKKRNSAFRFEQILLKELYSIRLSQNFLLKELEIREKSKKPLNRVELLKIYGIDSAFYKKSILLLK